jgi:hypothetical protein
MNDNQTAPLPEGVRLPRFSRYPRQQIDHWLNAQESSHLTVSAFCRQQNLNAKAFYRWRSERNKTPADVSAACVSDDLFQEIVSGSHSPAHWMAEVVLSSGQTWRFGAQANPQWIAQLMGLLNKPC